MPPQRMMNINFKIPFETKLSYFVKKYFVVDLIKKLIYLCLDCFPFNMRHFSNISFWVNKFLKRLLVAWNENIFACQSNLIKLLEKCKEMCTTKGKKSLFFFFLLLLLFRKGKKSEHKKKSIVWLNIKQRGMLSIKCEEYIVLNG